MHELCAIWTPEVYLDKGDHFKNLMTGIQRSSKLLCSHWGRFGAGLGCS